MGNKIGGNSNIHLEITKSPLGVLPLDMMAGSLPQHGGEKYV